MQNQAAVEALYSATFVEDYIDCIENLPNDLQRNLSRLREFDMKQHRDFLSELSDLLDTFERDTSLSAQKSTLYKIQQGLILTQDIGDDKLATVQSIADIIENKTRQLEQDSKNLDFCKEEENSRDDSKNSNFSSNGKSNKVKNSQSDDKFDKPNVLVKRRKKQQQQHQMQMSGSIYERRDKDDKDDSRQSYYSGTHSRGSGKKPNGKRKATRQKNSDKDRDDSDKDDIDMSIEIDPDEPTYCLCDQVSYGEMIGCDNDLCPIEWFHFNCVQLSNKPKGKWYCPKCRGDKSTTMKPKGQFLKELEKYNKEKEEKMMKNNG